jgi:hypothetical protein
MDVYRGVGLTMSVFEKVTLSFDGLEYEIAPDKILGLIAEIEDIVTLSELCQKKGPPMAKLAMAYGKALRYAGGKVADDVVYGAMFGKDKEKIAGYVSGLLAMMIPPEHLRGDDKQATEDDKKK